MMRFTGGAGTALGWSSTTCLATVSWMQEPWLRWQKTGRLFLRDSIVSEGQYRNLSKWIVLVDMFGFFQASGRLQAYNYMDKDS